MDVVFRSDVATVDGQSEAAVADGLDPDEIVVVRQAATAAAVGSVDFVVRDLAPTVRVPGEALAGADMRNSLVGIVTVAGRGLDLDRCAHEAARSGAEDLARSGD